MNISKKCIEISLLTLTGLSSMSCMPKAVSQQLAGYGAEYAPLTGVHCESSAMLNALTACGWNVSEEMIIGAGAAPSFIYQKGPFPFIGGRSLDMKERFFEAADIAYHAVIPEKNELSRDIIDVLNQKIPVVLRVDMRFLPYRYGGKYGPSYMSFGSHYITLFGIDTAHSIAYVSDTEIDGMQTISLKDLARSRFSSTKNFPPRGEYYWAEKNTSGRQLDPDALLASAVSGLIKNYENSALENLKNFSTELAQFESYSKNRFMYPAVFSYMADTIDKNGTGGACFRIPFRRFIQTYTQDTRVNEVHPVLEALYKSIHAWNTLSQRFRSFSASAKNTSAEERAAWYKKLADDAQTLYEAEKNLHKKLVDMHTKIESK